jgi:hypothetical protein
LRGSYLAVRMITFAFHTIYWSARELLRMITALRMGCLIASHPDLMEEIGNLCRQHALEFEAPQQIALRLFRTGEETGLGGSELGQQFGKLSKLDEAGVRIVCEIPLS